jgi:hypothetical protein
VIYTYWKIKASTQNIKKYYFKTVQKLLIPEHRERAVASSGFRKGVSWNKGSTIEASFQDLN